jgi:prophage antirepressor-like protein
MQNTENLLVKQFNGLDIEIHGTYEEPLFKAKDVGDLLEIKNIRDTVASFNNKQRRDVGLTDTIGREQKTTFLITELKNYLVKYLNAEVDKYDDIVGYTLIHHSDVLF